MYLSRKSTKIHDICSWQGHSRSLWSTKPAFMWRSSWHHNTRQLKCRILHRLLNWGMLWLSAIRNKHLDTAGPLNSFSLTPSFILINYTHLTLAAPQVHELHSKQHNRHCISASGETMAFSTTKSFFDTEMTQIFTMEHLNRPTRHVAFASSIKALGLEYLWKQYQKCLIWIWKIWKILY